MPSETEQPTPEPFIVLTFNRENCGLQITGKVPSYTMGRMMCLMALEKFQALCERQRARLIDVVEDKTLGELLDDAKRSERRSAG